MPKRSFGPSVAPEAKSAAVAPPAPVRLSPEASEDPNEEKTRVETLVVRPTQRGAPETLAASKGTTTEETPDPSSARPTNPPPPILDPQDVRALIEQAAAPLERQVRDLERRLGEMQRRLEEVEHRPVAPPAAISSIAPVPSMAPAPRVLSGFPGPVSANVAAAVGVATASRPPTISRPVIELAPSARPASLDVTDALVIDGRKRRLRLALAVAAMCIIVFGGLFAALAESYTHAHP